MTAKTITRKGQVFVFSHTANGLHHWHNKQTGEVWVTKVGK